MRLFRLFLGHELLTQWRSVRFRGLGAVYVIAGAAPAVALSLAAGRTPHVIGPAAYNTFLLSLQPLLTALFAVGLAVDAVSRERDEGSFAVLSVAPVSSIGYVLRRWLAVVVICAGASLVPTAITAAFALRGAGALPQLALFADGWLLAVLPPLLVASSLAIALGTITGRTVLAIIFGMLLITAGIGIADDLLFYAGLNFGGPGDLFTGGGNAVRELIWTIQGHWFPRVPSDAAFPLRSAARALLPRAGVTAAMAVVLLALSALYLRRTRRDLRPWRIPEKHQLRTMLRTANRVREEYAPDAGSSAADRAALAAAFVLAALLVAHLIRRQSMFIALGDARYAGEAEHGVPTSTSVVIESLRVDAAVTLGGTLRSRSTAVLRNDGASAQAHLSFMLQPMMSVRRLGVGRGTARAHRAWERLDLELDPPLAPRERRALRFDLEGMPAEIDFQIQSPGNFAVRWNRRRRATQSIYMTDLSRSTIAPAATEVRMRLAGSDLTPVIRYSAWTLQEPQPPEQDARFAPETIAPPAALDVHLAHPYPLAVDSCGTMAARGEMASRCTTGLASYVVFAAPLTRRPLGAEATVAYIPSHEALVAVQSHSLSASVSTAAQAWPRLHLPPHLIFVERPADPDERHWYFNYQPSRTLEEAGAGGSLFFVPESAFTTKRAIDPSLFAAAIITGVLRARRPVVSYQTIFFTNFYTAVAVNRLGMRKSSAVEPGLGVPDTAPLVGSNYGWGSRMERVLAALEYRVGADNFRDGIDDFVAAAGGPGTARELVAAIGRRAGVDLSRAYADYFAGHALPELTLDGVAFRREGGQWRVTGAVKNKATGEAFVPVVLRTAQGSLWQTVRVDGGGTAPFAFTAPGEPRSVQLDPDGVCYRRGVVGLVENVEYRGAS